MSQRELNHALRNALASAQACINRMENIPETRKAFDALLDAINEETPVREDGPLNLD